MVNTSLVKCMNSLVWSVDIPQLPFLRVRRQTRSLLISHGIVGKALTVVDSKVC